MAQTSNQFEDTIAIVGYDELDVASNVSFSKVTVNKVGGRNVGLKHKQSKQTLRISGPIMTGWGARKYVDESSGKVTFDLSLQFPLAGSDYDTPEEQEFLEKMKALEQLCKDYVQTNCRELLNKPKLTDEGLDLIWTPMIRYPKDKQTMEPDHSKAPTLKIKIPFWDGKWGDNLEIYDLQSRLLYPSEDHNVTPATLIPEGSATKLAVSIQCAGIWFAAGKCGVTWRLHQAVIKPKPKMGGRCLVKIPAAMRQAMEQSTDDSGEYDSKPAKVTATVVADSDDEDGAAQDDGEADDAVVADFQPEPAVTKKPGKVIRKKKQ